MLKTFKLTAWKKSRRFLCAWLFLQVATLTQASLAAEPVTVVLEKTTIASGEPVLLDLHVLNSTSDSLELDLGDNGDGNVMISETDPMGSHHEKLKESTGNEPLTVTFFGWLHLAPGQEYHETLVLNQWFSFKQTGRYRITVKLKKSAKIGKQPVSTDFAPLTLEVTPYDAKALASACRELASRIKKRTTAAESQAAERALSYVQDPAAVPYWNEVLEYVDGIAISSLYKIGNTDAVQVLARALHLRNNESRSQARSALEALSQRSPDPEVRAQAKLMLGKP